jgi:hypothetical protein
MPRLKSETFGTGDQSWLGSSHGIHECRTEVLDISAFTEATHYPDGYIPSGTPLSKVTSTAGGAEVGKYVVYDPNFDTDTATAGIQSDGRDVLAGFLLTDQPVVAGSGDFGAPLLDHGRVKVDKVPGTFTQPPAANDSTTIVYI